ncbi:hypothetical protein TRAPUB_4058, partial [Trametes pubescens]
MGRPSWASDEQTEWLWDRHDMFLAARRDTDPDTDTVSNFMTKTHQLFFDEFPLCADPLEPSPDGQVPTREERIAKREHQIYWWFWNRRFKKKSDRKAAHAGRFLGLVPKRARALQPYQAYMHLYKEKIMPEISDRYAEYKAELPEGEEPTKWWPFCMEQVKKLLENETDAVKAEVETKRKAAKTGVDWDVIFNADHDDDAVPITHEQALQMQSIIDNLPKVLQDLLKNVEKQASWKGCVLVGGPLPESGKLTVLCVHQGRTCNLGNNFPQASDAWSAVEEAFSKFIANCFPGDAAQRLADAFNAIPETAGSEQVTQDTPTPPSTSNSSAAASITSATPTESSPISPTTQSTTAPPKRTGRGSKGKKGTVRAKRTEGTSTDGLSNAAITPTPSLNASKAGQQIQI